MKKKSFPQRLFFLQSKQADMTGKYLAWLSDKKNSYLAPLVFGLIAYKLLLLIFIWLSPYAFPGLFSQAGYWRNFHWPDRLPPSAVSYFMTWDSQHYLYISQNAYKPHIICNAFLPLWPLMIRLFQWVTLGNHIASALVLANLFSIAGFVLFYRFVRELHGKGAASASLLLLLCFPTAYYFCLPYSESLFFLLSILFLRYLVKNNHAGVFVTAMLLTLTRSVGLLLVLPIFWKLVTSKEKGIGWLALLGPLVGLLVSMNIYLYFTGDAFIYYGTQKIFFINSPSIDRCFRIVDFLKFYFGRLPRIFGCPTGLFERIFFAWYVISLALLWRKDKLWFMFALPMGMVPALSSTLMSFTRYLVVIIPLFIIDFDPFPSPRKKAWFWAVLVSFVFLQAIFFIRHINNYWAA